MRHTRHKKIAKVNVREGPWVPGHGIPNPYSTKFNFMVIKVVYHSLSVIWKHIYDYDSQR